jgi:hypothetical protein
VEETIKSPFELAACQKLPVAKFQQWKLDARSSIAFGNQTISLCSGENSPSLPRLTALRPHLAVNLPLSGAINLKIKASCNDTGPMSLD